VYEQAQVRGANTFQMFSNTPVWWMCKNHNPCGSDIGAEDNLQTWNHGKFMFAPPNRCEERTFAVCVDVTWRFVSL